MGKILLENSPGWEISGAAYLTPRHNSKPSGWIDFQCSPSASEASQEDTNGATKQLCGDESWQIKQPNSLEYVSEKAKLFTEISELKRSKSELREQSEKDAVAAAAAATAANDAAAASARKLDVAAKKVAGCFDLPAASTP